MTNEELKKKICDIIAPYVSAYGDDERIADALIAAGIGDVNEEKSKAFVYANEIAYLDNQLKEYKHRAEVAERALRNIVERTSCNICENFNCRYYNCETYNYNAEECIKWWLAQAEKELAEEKKE